MLQAIEILLVEDSPTDRLIAIEALQSSKLINSLNVVENGVDATGYLRREGKYRDVRRPDLVISDNYFCRSTTIRFAESGAC